VFTWSQYVKLSLVYEHCESLASPWVVLFTSTTTSSRHWDDEDLWRLERTSWEWENGGAGSDCVKICSQHMAWTEPNYELRCEQPYWNARTRVESCDWSSTVVVSLQPIESWRWRLWRMNESRRSCNWVDLLQDGSVQFTYCEQSSMDTANSRAVARQIDLRCWDLRDFVNESAHAAADANSRRSSTRMYDTWPRCD